MREISCYNSCCCCCCCAIRRPYGMWARRGRRLCDTPRGPGRKRMEHTRKHYIIITRIKYKLPTTLATADQQQERSEHSKEHRSSSMPWTPIKTTRCVVWRRAVRISRSNLETGASAQSPLGSVCCTAPARGRAGDFYTSGDWPSPLSPIYTVGLGLASKRNPVTHAAPLLPCAHDNNACRQQLSALMLVCHAYMGLLLCCNERGKAGRGH